MRQGWTIHHNGPPANCVGEPHSRCEAFWRAVRSFHVNDKGWSDIAYSFGVCPHGERFVGRGWDKAQWANGSDNVGADNGDDSEWYTVLVFVGGDDSTHDNEPPTPRMISATAALIEEGRRTGRCGNRVTPHNFWKRKPCPGPEFTALAAAWDRKPSPLISLGGTMELTPANITDIGKAAGAAARQAVIAEFTEPGSDTRTALTELLRGQIGSEAGRLNQALDSWATGAGLRRRIDLDEATATIGARLGVDSGPALQTLRAAVAEVLA